jgi:hypothetical protein
VSGSTPDWISATATTLAAVAAVAAGVTAFLQWHATREQTRASLFSEKYAAYKVFKDQIQRAQLNEGSFGDAQAAQDTAHKLRFLFSTKLMREVDEVLRLTWEAVEERQLSGDNGQRNGGPHYDAMAAAAKQLRPKLQGLDTLFQKELSHSPD